MPETIHPHNSLVNMEQFKAQLALISYIFKQTELRYSLVGGLALENSALPYRVNGTYRDIDVLSLGPDEQTVDNILKLFDITRTVSDPTFPEVGLESARFSDSPAPHALLSILSGMRVASDGKVYITYREIEKEVSPETLETSIHMVNGIEFQRFPELTILLRYILRGGVLKPKDEQKVIKLLLHVMENMKGQPDLKYYRPYIEFIYEIKEKYPHILGLFSLFWTIDKLTGGQISGAKGKVYDLIGSFRG